MGRYKRGGLPAVIDGVRMSELATTTCPSCGLVVHAVLTSDGLPGFVHDNPPCQIYLDLEMHQFFDLLRGTRLLNEAARTGAAEAAPKVIRLAKPVPKTRPGARAYGRFKHLAGWKDAEASATRICEVLQRDAGDAGRAVEWLEVDTPPGWRSLQVNEMVAYICEGADLIVVPCETRTPVRLRHLMLFFPAELTAAMIVRVGSTFLQHGSGIEFGANYPHLRRETGKHCVTLSTCLTEGVDHTVDFYLTVGEIEAWMRRSLHRVSFLRAGKVGPS